MAHADRRRYLDPERQNRVIDRAGNGTNVILKAGRVAGIWDHHEKTLLFAPFEKLDAKKVGEAARRCLRPLEIDRVAAAPLPPPLGSVRQNDFMGPLRASAA